MFLMSPASSSKMRHRTFFEFFIITLFLIGSTLSSRVSKRRKNKAASAAT